ncbi:MAG: hypothetical protein HP023_11950 [Lachnospiraceae bacterium]|nr:hypothetical protein [Lachnospiraceae bacterium]
MEEGTRTLFEFLFNNIVNVFQKLSEEHLHLEGSVVERRLNAEEKIMYFFDSNLERKAVYGYSLKGVNLLKEHGLPTPYSEQVQCAKIFTSPELFEQFLNELTENFISNKMWLDEDVLLHLTFMRYYFEYLKIIPKKIRSVPLPKGQGLSDEEFKEIYQKVLLLLGYSFDVEIQGLRCQLDEKITNSIKKMRLSRSSKKIVKKSVIEGKERVLRKTELGKRKDDVTNLICDVVGQRKNCGINNYF